jgi:hypothetical protein
MRDALAASRTEQSLRTDAETAYGIMALTQHRARDAGQRCAGGGVPCH